MPFAQYHIQQLERNFPMKIKLDCYDLSILVNGLYTMRNRYNLETRNRIYELLLRIIDIYDNMNPNRKAKIRFESTEHRIILHCLIDWRNQFLQEGKPGAAEGVGELILKIT